MTKYAMSYVKNQGMIWNQRYCLTKQKKKKPLPETNGNGREKSLVVTPNIETYICITPGLSFVEEAFELHLMFIRKRRYGWCKLDVLNLLVHDAINDSLLPNLSDLRLIRNEHIKEC